MNCEDNATPFAEDDKRIIKAIETFEGKVEKTLKELSADLSSDMDTAVSIFKDRVRNLKIPQEASKRSTTKNYRHPRSLAKFCQYNGFGELLEFE